MTHYLFHLHHCGEIIPDEEGREFPDPATAMAHATREARGYLAAEIASGQLCLGCHIEVVNTETGEWTDMPFTAAVHLVSEAPE